ncbi:hypothetical protein RB213_013313 [Colletotrichum asianum]
MAERRNPGYVCQIRTLALHDEDERREHERPVANSFTDVTHVPLSSSTPARPTDRPSVCLSHSFHAHLPEKKPPFVPESKTQPVESGSRHHSDW